MVEHQSRRQFLQFLSSGVAVALSGSLPGCAAPALSAAGGGSIRSLTTNAALKVANNEPIPWQPFSGIDKGAELFVQQDQKFQQILGFGGAFTDAACYELNKLGAKARASVFQELFGARPGTPAGLNLNVCRTCIGASDYSTVAYSYDDGDPDPELKRFSIEHDRQWILPVLRQARQVNPELFLFSTPWSPPGWIKSNNSMLGGSMRPKYMDAYANYFLKFLRAYEAEGVPIQGITVQNEVDTDQDGRMPACTWSQEYEQGFVRDKLAPLLAKEGLKTKIWVIDHNYNLWGRALSELEDDDLRKAVDGIAWHGYLGQPQWMMRVHDAHPDTNMYWTEGGPDYTSKDYATDWSKWSQTFSGVLSNWCRSITVWNLALDQRGQPNIGPFSCGGLVTITDDGGITRSGQYWAMAHYSACIKRGARRIYSSCGIAGISHVAFENPDGELILVVTNAGTEDVEVPLRITGKMAALKLTKNSVNTFAWS